MADMYISYKDAFNQLGSAIFSGWDGKELKNASLYDDSIVLGSGMVVYGYITNIINEICCLRGTKTHIVEEIKKKHLSYYKGNGRKDTEYSMQGYRRDNK